MSTSNTLIFRSVLSLDRNISPTTISIVSTLAYIVAYIQSAASDFEVYHSVTNMKY
jgi:hypothetical protein